MKLTKSEKFVLVETIENRIRQLELYAEDGEDDGIREAADDDIKLLRGILEKMSL